MKIGPYNFELYPFKVCTFLETQCGSTQPTTLKTFGGDNKQHYATDVEAGGFRQVNVLGS